MKRVNHLYEKLISRANVKKAIREVNSGHRSSHGRLNKTVLWVEEDIEARVDDLIAVVENGFVPKPTRDFTVYDTTACKTREIHEPALWPDQYIHHMLVQVLLPVMMRGMDYWCCASIPGRGTARGIDGIKRWMAEDVSNKNTQNARWQQNSGLHRGSNSSDTRYAVECDIHHFYDSLKPEVVMQRMNQLVKDKKVMDLIWRVIQSGIMIGAFPSQWFANTVLQPMDHMIREKLHVKHYVRYMDNLTMFSSNKKELHAAVLEVNKWLNEHQLELKPNWHVYNTTLKRKAQQRRNALSGKAYYRRHPRLVNAMGYMFGHGYTLMRKKNLFRLKRQLSKVYKKMRNHEEIPYKMAAGLLSRLSMLTHCNSRHINQMYVKKGLVKTLKNVVREESRRRMIRYEY